ncbi:hypothetical protein V6N11_079676 [Hibiscus sabdariffa]|uniref:Uncharacterized protein n=1 Tax=Hibiscus sabdariffa TaxID=183260 RepID=A0ABR2RWS5_9ROSI
MGEENRSGSILGIFPKSGDFESRAMLWNHKTNYTFHSQKSSAAQRNEDIQLPRYRRNNTRGRMKGLRVGMSIVELLPSESAILMVALWIEMSSHSYVDSIYCSRHEFVFSAWVEMKVVYGIEEDRGILTLNRAPGL